MTTKKAHDPKTNAEWQEAVNCAAACRAIADCKMYGLLEGGPEIDVARCDDIMERGAARGIRPTVNVRDAAIQLIAEHNAGAVKREQRA